jgi:outer membrane protein TolC
VQRSKDGGALIAEMNQSKAEFWSLRSERNNAAISLEQNIRSTAAAAIASFEQIGLTEKEAQAAKENYDLVNEAYLEGEAALIEQIDAQRQLVEANRDHGLRRWPSPRKSGLWVPRFRVDASCSSQ